MGRNFLPKIPAREDIKKLMGEGVSMRRQGYRIQFA
jgi:hypothetical protein